MLFLRFKTVAGVLNVPVSDLKSVLEQPDGSGTVAFKTDLPNLHLKDVAAVLQRARLAEPVSTKAAPSIFETIFGK